MARIPVERERRGSPWWIWLIGLIIIACVIWLLAELFNSDNMPNDEVVEGTEQTQPAPPPATSPISTGLITEAATLLTTANTAALIGRTVALDSMRVDQNLGDTLFVVSPVAGAASPMTGADTTGQMNRDTTMAGTMMGRHILVALQENQPASPSRVENTMDVTAGQMVSIQGRVAQADSTTIQRWNLDQERFNDVLQNRVYIRATSVQADSTLAQPLTP